MREVETIALSTERDRLELDLRVALGTALMANFGWAHPSLSEAMEPAFALAKAFGVAYTRLTGFRPTPEIEWFADRRKIEN